ncbi:hypothetical protein EYF80_044879 [Liparis tanakae]|uniref:Uncharacterized protein n=1 Tax=Liparis tanakae TaxID=230148 RepID=A0A4Z2FWH4_9TELE|nr:hypothetical protein EYF80_044879 [Liparis tanakae]
MGPKAGGSLKRWAFSTSTLGFPSTNRSETDSRVPGGYGTARGDRGSARLQLQAARRGARSGPNTKEEIPER